MERNEKQNDLKEKVISILMKSNNIGRDDAEKIYKSIIFSILSPSSEELNPEMISDINNTLRDYYGNYPNYQLNSNGHITYKEKLDENDVASILFKERELHCDVLCNEKFFYEPIEDFTIEEIEKCINSNDENMYKEIGKTKLINKINSFSKNKISEINEDDTIPFEFIYEFYLGSEEKRGNDGNSFITDSIRNDIFAELSYHLEELKQKKEYSTLKQKKEYSTIIDEVIVFIKKTYMDIEISNIPKEVIVDILSKEYNENISNYGQKYSELLDLNIYHLKRILEERKNNFIDSKNTNADEVKEKSGFKL